MFNNGEDGRDLDNNKGQTNGGAGGLLVVRRANNNDDSSDNLGMYPSLRGPRFAIVAKIWLLTILRLLPLVLRTNF